MVNDPSSSPLRTDDTNIMAAIPEVPLKYELVDDVLYPEYDFLLPEIEEPVNLEGKILVV